MGVGVGADFNCIMITMYTNCVSIDVYTCLQAVSSSCVPACLWSSCSRPHLHKSTVLYKWLIFTGVVLCQDIGDFVALADGANEMCQVMVVDIIQFLRRKQLGLTTLESITIDEPRAISIPSSHLVPLNSQQTAITVS